VSFINHGDKWLPAAGPLHILALLGLLFSFTSYPGTIWLSKGKVRLRICWAGVMLLSVVIAVLAGRPYGVEGICRALVVRGLVFFPVILTVTYRIIGLSPFVYMATLLPSIICGTVMLGFTYGCSVLIPGNSFSRDVAVLSAGIGGGLLVYGLTLAVFFRKTCRSFREVFVSLRRGI
jgi:O-antigen/teichoic acid export membrane protein